MLKEFIERGIHVNSVLLDFVSTAMMEGTAEYSNKMEKQFMGIIDPIQVAYLVEYLPSDKAKYITGAVLPISGEIC